MKRNHERNSNRFNFKFKKKEKKKKESTSTYPRFAINSQLPNTRKTSILRFNGLDYLHPCGCESLPVQRLRKPLNATWEGKSILATEPRNNIC